MKETVKNKLKSDYCLSHIIFNIDLIQVTLVNVFKALANVLYIVNKRDIVSIFSLNIHMMPNNTHTHTKNKNSQA